MQSKNRCLEKLIINSETFLKSAESGDLSNIGAFEERRNSIIAALQIYDRKISDLITHLSPSEKTHSLIQQAKRYSEINDILIQSISDLDKKIIIKIEEEKCRIMKELSSSEKQNAMVKKFKSTWVPEAGERLDGKL